MDGARLFSDLMKEVIAASGGDHRLVLPLFEKEMRALPPEERTAIADLLDKVSRFEEPQKPFENN